MKGNYTKPTMNVEQFVANEYVAACGDTDQVYKFNCDMPKGNLYEETNGVAGLQTKGSRGVSADKLLYSNVWGCNQYHEAKVLGSDFRNGYAVSGGRTIPVTIWYEKGTGGATSGKTVHYNTHATTDTNKSTWEITKS